MKCPLCGKEAERSVSDDITGSGTLDNSNISRDFYAVTLMAYFCSECKLIFWIRED